MSTLTKKYEKDTSGDWVDLDILGTVYAFVCEDVFD